MSRTLLLILSLHLLTTAAACSLFRHHPAYRWQSGREDDAPLATAQRLEQTMIKERPRKLRVKIQPYIYTYEMAWSERTDQFILAPSVRRVKPLERAVKIRIKIPAQLQLNTRKAQKHTAGKGVRPELSRTMRHKGSAYKPKQKQDLRLTVHFGLNSARITAVEARRLKDFASQIKGRTSYQLSNVNVAGYTCWLGSKELNDRLALRRAMAVVHALGKEGIKVSSITATGKCCYIDLNNPAPNRRAEIKAKFK